MTIHAKKIRNWKWKYPVVAAILLLAGLSSGMLLGKGYLSNFLESNNRLAFLLYRPANQYFAVRSLLHSRNYLDRLTAYYSFVDNDMIDREFLVEAYQKEKIIPVKRTIVWSLGFSENFEAVIKNYDRFFREGEPEIQQEILQVLKRRDINAYHEFVKRHGIPTGK